MVGKLSLTSIDHDSMYHYIVAFIGLVTLVFVTLLVIGGSPTEDDDNNPDENDMEDDTEEAGNNGDDVDAMERGVAAATSAAPKTKRMVSIAHDDIKSKKIVYIHIDVEDGGPMCGLLQISFVALDADYKELGRFNEFVKPPINAIWNEEACKETHNYHKEHPKIVNAQPIEVVWPKMVAEVERHLVGGKVGMFLAWSGEGSDLTKMFTVTEITHRGILDMPPTVKYFCDPKYVISHYKTCDLNEKQRKPNVPVGYGIATVYNIAYDEALNGAHDSEVDTDAQVRLCKDDRVKDFIDKNVSVKLMDEVWVGKKKRKAEVAAEKTRQVPWGWDDAPDFTYEIPRHLQYTSIGGGGVRGPTSQVTEACRKRNLADLFLFFMTIEMLQELADESNKYGNETYVRQVTKEEYRNGLPRQRSKVTINIDDCEDDSDDEDDDDSDWDPNEFVACNEDDGSCGSEDSMDELYEIERQEKKMFVECDENHPGARKRFKETNKNKWHKFTVGYLLAFFGICIIIIGSVGMRFWKIAWMEEEGLSYPFVQNTMTRQAFEQCLRFLHFVPNKSIVPQGHHKWTPLQKIQPFVNKILARFRAGYNMGQFMSADESMIKYKGNQIKWKQYMPAKPVKHGMKVFGLSDAISGYHYGYYVYTGKENDNASPVEIIKKLLDQDPDFEDNSAGRVLYTDNYYTSEAVMKMLFTKFKIFLVGTVSLTKKKSRSIGDFAFHLYSAGAKRQAGKGHLRWAIKPVSDAAGKVLYWVQNTTWMDRKQVGIMHNYMVCPPGDCTTLRYNAKDRKRMPVKTHPVIPDYVTYMKGVDKTDRSIADYIVIFRAMKYYMAIFWFAFSSLLANCRVITKEIVEQAKQQREKDYNKAVKAYFRKKKAYDIRKEEGAVKDGEKPPEMPKKTKDLWEDYVSGEKGWFHWMLDMGHALIKAGILREWDPSDPNSERPSWMRQVPFKACTCKNKCFFCEYKLTGPRGPPIKVAAVTPAKRRAPPAVVSSTKKVVRNTVKDIERDHVTIPEAIFTNSRDCGICLEENRVRKPTGVEKNNTHINRCTLGCPHLLCREHPVCKEHWPKFKHKRLKYA